MSSSDVPNAPRVFRLYPNDEDRLRIVQMFEAQEMVYAATMKEIRESPTPIMTGDECFDRVVPRDLLRSLSAFGDVALSVLHDVVDFAVSRHREDVERGIHRSDDDVEYPHAELGFSVPSYYLSFFFDESTSIGFGEIGPMPTSLDYDATDSISELIVVNDESLLSSGIFNAVLIDRDGLWA
jgi:hypothetical protein